MPTTTASAATRSIRAGWITCDADARRNPDVVATLPPVPDEFEGADVFRLIHVLEHFYKWEAVELLAEFHRLLKPGGRLVLELPNLESAIATLSGANSKPVNQWGMWVLYGNPDGKNPWYGHKWGWTPDTLSAELRRAGFKSENIRSERPRFHVPARDFRLVALK